MQLRTMHVIMGYIVVLAVDNGDWLTVWAHSGNYICNLFARYNSREFAPIIDCGSASSTLQLRFGLLLKANVCFYSSRTAGPSLEFDRFGASKIYRFELNEENYQIQLKIDESRYFSTFLVRVVQSGRCGKHGYAYSWNLINFIF